MSNAVAYCREEKRASAALFPGQLSWFIALSIWSAAAFCEGVRLTQFSKTSFSSGVSSTTSPSAKNWDSVIPKPLQMVSSVSSEGLTFRL